MQESLTEEETDAAEELRQLSGMSGTFYLITDAFKTGTYVANGAMTIKQHLQTLLEKIRAMFANVSTTTPEDVCTKNAFVTKS